MQPAYLAPERYQQEARERLALVLRVEASIGAARRGRGWPKLGDILGAGELRAAAEAAVEAFEAGHGR